MSREMEPGQEIFEELLPGFLRDSFPILAMIVAFVFLLPYHIIKENIKYFKKYCSSEIKDSDVSKS